MSASRPLAAPRLLAVVLIAGLPLSGQRPGEGAKPAPPVQREPLGQAATAGMVARYGSSEHWLQKAVILMSLNTWWHPVGSGMILQAVTDKDKRLRAYGVEALLRATPELLPAVASKELVEELVTRQLGQTNKHYRARVLEALARIAPKAGAEDKGDWQKWWRSVKDTYAPQPWQDRSKAKDGDEGTVALMARAFDLYRYGLDLTLCIDSTGSMQPSIDAVSAALGEMVDILKGISPEFRLGVVHYKEKGDFGDADRLGAKTLAVLSKNVPAARNRLLKLKAKGGGDLPEQVCGGLELAYGANMKWAPDANKLVIVIGDAPPHDPSKATSLATKARTEPASFGGNRPTTGQTVKPRPFITSAIGVRLEVKDSRIRVPAGFTDGQTQMQTHFKAIAESGGGVYADLVFPLTVEKGKIVPVQGAHAEFAAQKMVEHILALSFGKEFVQEMQAFVRIYYEYREARWFK